MNAPNLDPTERIPVPAAPVAARRVAGLSARSLTALLVVALVVAAVIVLRPTANATPAAATPGPTAASSDGAPPATTPALEATPAQPTTAPTVATVETAAPTERASEAPGTPKPTRHPTPTTAVPATFAATLTVTASCSTSPGMEGVSLTASFAGPDFITRVVLFVDGNQVAPVEFDPPGLQVGGAGSGTSVTADVPHEATASFYSGPNSDVLVQDGVSSGAFTVALTGDCG